MDHLPATYRTGHQRRRFLRRQAPVPLRGGSSGRGDRYPRLSLNGGAAGCGPQDPPPVIHLADGQSFRFAAGVGDHAAPFAGGPDGAPAFLSVVIGFSAELLPQGGEEVILLGFFHRQLPAQFSDKRRAAVEAGEQVQMVLCPGHRHIKEPALLLIPPFLLRALRLRNGRQNSIQHVQKVDRFIFQALAGMDGGEDQPLR